MANLTKIANSRLGEVRFPKVDSPPGEVITYTLSPEELEKYRSMTSNTSGPKPVRPFNLQRKVKEELMVEVKQGVDKQEAKLQDAKQQEFKQSETQPALTKEYVESQLAAGKSALQIERELGLPYNSIYYHLKKWGLSSSKSSKKKATEEQLKTESKEIETKNDINVVSDPVNHPAHYTTGGIETIDFIQAKLSKEQFEGYVIGNVLKYCSRANHKGGLEDLKKARWYLDRLIESVSCN